MKTTPIHLRILQLLNERNISVMKFSQDTGINRAFFYRKEQHTPRKATLITTALYLKIPLKELVQGTDMEDEI